MNKQIISKATEEKEFLDGITVSDDLPQDEVVKGPKQVYDLSNKAEYHDIANREPMMTQEELDGLVDSMKKHGFKSSEPILIYEKQILDGRNRTVAARHAKVKVKTINFVGTYDEAVEESLRLNNRRRHKSIGQKAMAAAYALEVNKAQADDIEKEILKVNPSIGVNKLAVEKGQKCPKLTGKDAAKQQGCSIQSVKNATTLLNNDKELAAQVFNGEISITEGMKRYLEILLIREASVSKDGDHSPEELEHIRQVESVKQDPEGAVIKMDFKDNQIDKLKKEVKELKSKLSRSQDEVKELKSNSGPRVINNK